VNKNSHEKAWLTVFHRLYSSILAIAAMTFSCATISETRLAPSEDLYCEQDSDCELVKSTLIQGECCGHCAEQQAISHTAADRYRLHLDAECGGEDVDCTLIGYRCCNTGFSDWTAVCTHNTCKRRSARFFGTPKPSCGIGTTEAAPPNKALNATVGRGRPPAR
jgi:hypothetical protein